MRFFRVIMSAHLQRGEWRSSVQMPTFYVHAVTAIEASHRAADLALATADALDSLCVLGSSGSLIEVDPTTLDPKEIREVPTATMQEATYFSWSDL